MKRIFQMLFLILILAPVQQCNGQEKKSDTLYEFRSGDPNGIGKWYMGREIAHVMGFQGMSWLERPEREVEENTSILLENMNIQLGDTIADIGAGSGYHVFKMAHMASEGHIYAVDIQDEMLRAIEQKQKKLGTSNISTIKGSPKSVHLMEESIDKILMVDVYHEFDFPIEMMASMKKALRPNGLIYLIEYRSEDTNVPIKRIHKMSEEQAVLEMKEAGFELERNVSNLPWQHCMIFIKK